MSTLTKQQRSFAGMRQKGDLRGAVRLAHPVALEAIFTGNINEDAVTLAQTLAGEVQRDSIEMVEWDVCCGLVFAAFAVGISIGHIVSPAAFEGGAQ